MNILDDLKLKDMRIHILKNYVRELQRLLDCNTVDYSEIRKKYLFQYSLTNGEHTSDDKKKSLSYLRRVSRSDKL